MVMIGSPGATVAFPRTTVYNATKAAAWADLDLSAVVGSRQAVVILKIEKDATANADYGYLRRNGDASQFNANIAISTWALSAGEAGYYVCVTDPAGIMEWFSEDAVPVYTVIVEAYAHV